MKFFILSFLFSCQIFANPLFSQKRFPGETYEQAVQRFFMQLSILDEQPPGESAFETKVKMDEVDDAFKKRIPEFATFESLKQAFEWSRDERFISDPEFQNFQRRISWLYPDDGCFARAQVAQKMIRDHFEGSDLGKVFIFGNLSVKTKNSPDGEVEWWYHVVPAARIGNEVWVLDAAIEPKKLLKLEEWIATMVPQDEDFSINFCKNESYSPPDSCLKPDDMSMEDALLDQSFYLRSERDRLIELKRDPDEELGENPPWLRQETPQPDKPKQPPYTPQYLAR